MTNSYRIWISAGAVLTAVSLSGCRIAETLQNESSHEFDTVSVMEADWNADAKWVPTDATEIQLHASLDGEIAILGATTPSDLDPTLCGEVERQSGPVYGEDWAPDAYGDDAWACGVWTVIPTIDGWFGWTPNDPDEQAASPTGMPSGEAPSIDTTFATTVGAGAPRG
jgi:hypothetical protein